MSDSSARDTAKEGDVWQKTSDEWFIYLDGKWVLMNEEMQLEYSK